MSGRIGTVVASTAVMLASMAIAGPAASARPETVDSVHRTWACTVPSGFTWSQLRINTRCAFRYEYFLLDAVNYDLTGQWACTVPSGYTYTSSRQGTNCAVSSGQSPYEYRLAKV